jgi:phosphotriesterase-related protein
MKRIVTILIVIEFTLRVFSQVPEHWAGKVMTVGGLISPDSMGITLPHEHLLIVHKFNYLDLTNEADAINELGYYANAGGKTLAEASVIGIGRNPEGLKRISKATGVNVIMSAGYYKDQWIPDSIKSKSIGELTQIIINDIMNGVNGIHAGFIKIAMSRPITPFEEKVLVAAARAQKATGAALEVHFDGDLATTVQKHHVLDVFENEGVDLSRVCLNHAVPYVDLVDDFISLAQRGCYQAFDMLGLEVRVAFQHELQLTETLNALIDAGYIEQILMSQDVCFSVCYVKNGGYGYGHILNNLLPKLKTSGITDEQIHTMMVENPKRMFPFKNYDDMGQCVNETFTAVTGTVSDNSGGGSYHNNMSCEKLIQPPGAVNITLAFNSFATETGYDFVRIYDGSTTSSALLGEFSGISLPSAVTSTGGSMLVVFTTDGGMVDAGWTATYTGNMPVLNVSPDSGQAGAASGILTFTVSSNINWSVSEGSAWFTATKVNDSTLTVKYEKNISLNPRSSEITVSGEGVTSQYIMVNQSGATPAIVIAPHQSMLVSSASGTITFKVSSNIPWSLNGSSTWFTAVKTDDTTITVVYDKNVITVPRSAEIMVSGEGVSSQYITVNQSGADPVLVVTPESQPVSASTGTTTFTVISNIDWSVSVNANWLTAIRANDTVLKVVFDENIILDSRSAEITVSGEGVTPQNILVIQSGASPNLSVLPASRPVSSASGTTTFTISSNIDWSVSESSSWLEAIKSDATTLIVIYSENTNRDSRTAEISINGAGVNSQSVSVMQDGAIPSTVKNPSEMQLIKVFPNPVSDKTRLTYPKGTVELIEIYESSGRLINRLQDPCKTGETEIDFSGFNSGLYIYRLIGSQGNVYIGKIWKE